jgi:hypothetical protein
VGFVQGSTSANICPAGIFNNCGNLESGIIGEWSEKKPEAVT